MKNSIKPQTRTSDLVEKDLLGETIIYDLTNDRAFCLNPTLALVWKSADGTKSIDELAKYLEQELNHPISEEVIWLALDELKKENLISAESNDMPKLSGVDRRELIKRIGLGSMVALPVLSSMIVPTAAQAQSTCVTATNPCVLGVTICCPDEFEGQTFPTSCQEFPASGEVLCFPVQQP